MHRKYAIQSRDGQTSLAIKVLDKPVEFVLPSEGGICAGARDRPPLTGNVRRGAWPLAQLGPAPAEAAMIAEISRLDPESSLLELIQRRSVLVSGPKELKERSRRVARKHLLATDY